MNDPEFYGALEPDGRFEGMPFDGLQTAPFRERRSRMDLSGNEIVWYHGGWDLMPFLVPDPLEE